MEFQALSSYNLIDVDFKEEPDPGEVVFSLHFAESSSDLNLPGKETGEIALFQKVVTGGTAQYKGMVSLGSRAKADQESVRRTGAAIVRWMQKRKQTSASIDPAELLRADIKGSLAAFVEGLQLGAFRFDHYKSNHKDREAYQFHIVIEALTSEMEQEVRLAQTVTAAVNLARDWGHEPANIINPVTLAERIQTLVAGIPTIRCKVLDEKALAEINAGGILAVGRGSATPPRMIVLEYAGSEQPEQKPVVLVGKALTYDTGGYSIKDVANIQREKYDKTGGLQVLAILMAAAAISLKTPLVGVIGAAENMISSKAYRPDDILTLSSGKTVEIITTDAEGRLVLADALTYAQRNFAPREIIDLATLTGGIVVALGHVRAGIMSNNDRLANDLCAAGERTYERLWRMPLDADYLTAIKGDDADLKNSGGREGHPIYGAVFLKEFIEDATPWAHLDIAGMADTTKELPYSPKGATGFGVRLLVDYLRSLE